MDRRRLAGFIGISGPYDFLPLGPGYLQEVFPPALRGASQPVNFVDGFEPPSLLLHGDDDETVSMSNARSLAAAIDTAGGRVELDILNGSGHARPALALSPALKFLDPVVLDESAAFMRRLATTHAALF